MAGWTVSAGSALAVVALIGGGAFAASTLGDDPAPAPKEQEPVQLVEPVDETLTVADETTTLEAAPEPTPTAEPEPTATAEPAPEPEPTATTEETTVTQPEPEPAPAPEPVEPIQPESDAPLGSPDGPTPGPPTGGIVEPAP